MAGDGGISASKERGAGAGSGAEGGAPPFAQLFLLVRGDGIHRIHRLVFFQAEDGIRDGHVTGVQTCALPILVIQDRQFNPDGTFRYPVSDIPGVTWIGEYFGDHMLVNGKVWPYLDVKPRMYRFRVLNGCNARIM